MNVRWIQTDSVWIKYLNNTIGFFQDKKGEEKKTHSLFIGG